MADKQPTAKDIALLSQRPDLASKFDEVYGKGAAAEVLAKLKPQPAQAKPAEAKEVIRVQPFEALHRQPLAQQWAHHLALSVCLLVL